MRYSVQHMLGGDGWQLSNCIPWDSDNARFSSCALPVLASIPLAILSSTTVFRFLLPQWQLDWISPFVPEELSPKIEENRPYFWPSLLFLLAGCATASQIIKVVEAPELLLHDVFLSISWLSLLLTLYLHRPTYFPARLFAFYLSASVAEISSADLRTPTTDIRIWLHISASVCGLLSNFAVLCMPVLSKSSSSGPISAVGSKPTCLERTPEDGLRLWQFLTVTWVWPLMAIGKERQLQKEDLWKISDDLQANRLATAFRKLQQSSVFRRLLRANAVDCCILPLSACFQLVLEFSSPILLHQFLRIMERPSLGKQAATIYAILLLALGVLTTQFSMLGTWYGRRCYERTRSVLILAVFQKTWLRKIIFSSDEQENSKTNTSAGKSNKGKPTENIANSHISTAVAAGSHQIEGKEATVKDTTRQSDKSGDYKSGNQAARLALFKELWWGNAATIIKSTGPATTGQVLNIVRSDVSEIAQRFRDIPDLIKTPVGLVIAIWLIWTLLGPSCLLGVLVIVISQVLNATVTHLQVRWRRKGKQAKDARIQITSQYIEVIRHLRWCAWHEVWLKKVFSARQYELNVRFVGSCLSLLTYTITTSAGALFPVAAFIAYTAVAKQELRIDLIFPALQLFSSLQGRLRKLPTLITSLLNAFVAMERIEEYDQALDLDKVETSKADSAVTNANLQNCSFAWPGSSSPVLENINLVLSTGLTLVYGEIGAGKTALLLALLNEMDQLYGQSELPSGPIGYCSQTPWLQSTSIRENILFSSPYEEERYKKVLDSCELLSDIGSFKDGDLSLLGENGVGLSGGQRARVALARAVYSQAKVLVLDDPFAALDHSTAERIIRKCFAEESELLHNRAFIIATHRTELIRHLAVQFVKVSNGKVSVYSEDPFKQHTESKEEIIHEIGKQLAAKANTENRTIPQKFIEDEKREHGGIKLGIFKTFVKAGSFWWVVLFGTLTLTRLFGVAEQWFYKSWGEAYGESSSPQNLTTVPQYGQTKRYWSLNPTEYLPNPGQNISPWLISLVVVSAGRALSLGLYALSQVTAIYATTRFLFSQALIRISNATFRYYDITPSGRIMNRITSDVDVLQSALDFFGTTIFSASFFLVSVVVIAMVSPVFLFFAAALMIVFALIFRQFLPTSRSLKRMETSSLSPLYSIFGELLGDHGTGLVTVRAFHAQSAFDSRTFSVVDQSQVYGHFFWSVQTWLTYRYDMISALSTFLLTVTALATDLSPGLTAFLLLNANNLVQSTHMLCTRFGGLQAEFVSVERIAELLVTEQEPIGSVHPPASWPQVGSTITFKGVTVRYAPHLETSLRDVSLSIPGGSTTAIIGRTGSGKSTLAATLLNIVRPELGGIITIDNISLTDINVTDLRRRITFIPQDPVLFFGTVRENLDPINEFTDEQCSSVLQRICSVASFSEPWTLHTQVQSGGHNFSQGQRQVFGIARAILRQSGVVILDEAMASIDVTTAAQLQKILREELSGATIVMIAHRMDKEMLRDVDYEIVLENGAVVRQGFLATG